MSEGLLDPSAAVLAGHVLSTLTPQVPFTGISYQQMKTYTYIYVYINICI